MPRKTPGQRGGERFDADGLLPRLRFAAIPFDDDLPRPALEPGPTVTDSNLTVYFYVEIARGLANHWGERFDQARGGPQEVQEWFLIYNTQLLHEFKMLASADGAAHMREIKSRIKRWGSMDSFEKKYRQLVHEYIEIFKSRIDEYSQPLEPMPIDWPLNLVSSANHTLAQAGTPQSADEELNLAMSTYQPSIATHLYLALLRPGVLQN